MGIDANRVAMLTFAVSGVLAAFGHAVRAHQPRLPGQGHLVITKAFVIIISSAAWAACPGPSPEADHRFCRSLRGLTSRTTEGHHRLAALVVILCPSSPQGISKRALTC